MSNQQTKKSKENKRKYQCVSTHEDIERAVLRLRFFSSTSPSVVQVESIQEPAPVVSVQQAPSCVSAVVETFDISRDSQINVEQCVAESQDDPLDLLCDFSAEDFEDMYSSFLGSHP